MLQWLMSYEAETEEIPQEPRKNEVVNPSILGIDQYKNKAQQELFISERDLIGNVVYHETRKTREAVPTQKIVSALNTSGWTEELTNRGPHYIPAMIQAIQNTENGTLVAGQKGLDLNEKPVEVVNWGGLYIVMQDGRHRTLAAKLIGKEEVPAIVSTPITPPTLLLDTPADYAEFEARRQLGLWEGDITISENGERSYARAQVTAMDGAWVLAKDIAKAKQMYEAIGADGQLEGVAKLEVTEDSIERARQRIINSQKKEGSDRLF
jgi:hypothetical protein